MYLAASEVDVWIHADVIEDGRLKEEIYLAAATATESQRDLVNVVMVVATMCGRGCSRERL